MIEPLEGLPEFVRTDDFNAVACVCPDPFSCRCVRVRMAEDGELELWAREPREIEFRLVDGSEA